MEKRALIVTSVASMVAQFLIPNIVTLQELGYSVTVACNYDFGSSCSPEKVDALKKRLTGMDVKCVNILFPRSPFTVKLISAYKELKKLVKLNKFDLVHCHTPAGAACTRLACRELRKTGLKVIYTAHGFHFFKGAPIKNWLIYYPIEKLCSYWTDVLITINKEDYSLAKRKMKAKRIEYIPGVGIDTNKFINTEVDRESKRHELGISNDNIMLLSVGELNDNKNHEVVIRALAQISNTNIHYFIAGIGDKKEYLESLALELNVNLHLLGYRTDIAELLKVSNIYVHPSFREGLNVSIMEAMATALPCIVGNIRGNVDLIDDNGGLLFDPHSINSCKNAIASLIDKDLNDMGIYNQIKIKRFDIEAVNKQMNEIYARF